MEFTTEQLHAKYETLPEEIKGVLNSETTNAEVLEIAQAHNLHIDQIGTLEEETTYVILGLRRASDFAKAIARKTGIKESDANLIVRDINDKVFLPIRSHMQAVGPQDMDDAQEDPNMTKDNILAEIENPTPVEHPISIAKEIPAFPIAREITQEQAPIPAPVSAPEKTKEAVAHDFIAEKLSGTVNIQPQQPTAQTGVSAIPEKPKAYVADPYREPLV